MAREMEEHEERMALDEAEKGERGGPGGEVHVTRSRTSGQARWMLLVVMGLSCWQVTFIRGMEHGNFEDLHFFSDLIARVQMHLNRLHFSSVENSDRDVDYYTSDPSGVGDYTSDPSGVDDYTNDPSGVDDYTSDPSGVGDYTSDPSGLGDYTSDPSGVDDSTDSPTIFDEMNERIMERIEGDMHKRAWPAVNAASDLSEGVYLRKNMLYWRIGLGQQFSKGPVHLHAGTSCDNIGPSFYDAEQGPNPWATVYWRSNDNNESTGALDIAKLKGAYTSSAYYGRVAAFYNLNGELLVCKIVEFERYFKPPDLGVVSLLNGGFPFWGPRRDFVDYENEKVKGIATLRRNNILNWVLHRLGPAQTGSLSIDAGHSCSDLSKSISTIEWRSDEYGISTGELTLANSKYPYEKMVGRAVVVRDSDGKTLACDKLDFLKEDVSGLLKSSKAEFARIRYRNKEHKWSGRAVLSHFQNIPKRCLDLTLRYSDGILRSTEFIEAQRAAYNSAVRAVSLGSTKFDEVMLVHKFELAQRTEAQRFRSIRSTQMFYEQNCALTHKCKEAAARVEMLEEILVAIIEKLERLEPVLNFAWFGHPSLRLTEFNELKAEKKTLETSIRIRVARANAMCPENYSCGRSAVSLGRCTLDERRDQIRLNDAESSIGVLRTLLDLVDAEAERQRLLQATKVGLATESELNHLYLLYEMQLKVEAFHVRMPYMLGDDPALGSVELTAKNVLSWNLNLKRLPPGTFGHIVIHEGTSCDAIDSPAALQNTTLLTSVLWKASSETEGSVDLSTFYGTLVFENSLWKPVVVYDASMKPLACGMLEPIV